jgi:hypothetical protein
MTTLDLNHVKQFVKYIPETGEFVRLQTNRTTGKINRDGYIEVQIHKKRFLAHRLAWLWVHGEWPVQNIDHANRTKTDNRIENLRYLTPSQQNQNTNLSSLNVSGYRGVSWDSTVKRWRARIRVNNKKYSLGYFDDPLDAYQAYLKAVPLYHTHNPLVELPEWLRPRDLC